MVKLVWDPGFKKAYTKRIRDHKSLKKRFWNTLEIFIEDPFEPVLRTHKLSGKLTGLWTFSVDYDCRIIFRFFDRNKTALLIDVGSHEEVY